jgi:1-acyl-sn-glycerol-3-phosphate acyltransferase
MVTLRPPQGKTTVTEEDIANVMSPSPRVQAMTRRIFGNARALNPFVDLYRPYIDGVEMLPADGRFLLVGNHTSFGIAEVFFIPYVVHRELGVRVRPLAERRIAAMTGIQGDLLAAFGGVLGHPETAAELMRHGETVLVFPGGGREMSKFKGEEYRLKWDGRSGFARVAIANDYPIVPVGLVGGDDVYRSLATRDGLLGKLSQALSSRLTGEPDMAMAPVRGIGPTMIPRPQRMYLRFGTPIDTTRPSRTRATAWEAAVKERTQSGLETILRDLQELRQTDPYQSLNPLAWRTARMPGPPQIGGAGFIS